MHFCKFFLVVICAVLIVVAEEDDSKKRDKRTIILGSILKGLFIKGLALNTVLDILTPQNTSALFAPILPPTSTPAPQMQGQNRMLPNSGQMPQGQQQLMSNAGQQQIMQGGGQQQTMQGGGQPQIMQRGGQQQMMQAGGQQQMAQGGGEQQMMQGGGQQQMMFPGGQQKMPQGPGQQPMMQGGGQQPMMQSGGQQPMMQGGGPQQMMQGGGPQQMMQGGGQQQIMSPGGQLQMMPGGGQQQMMPPPQQSIMQQGGAQQQMTPFGGQQQTLQSQSNGGQPLMTSNGGEPQMMQDMLQGQPLNAGQQMQPKQQPQFNSNQVPSALDQSSQTGDSQSSNQSNPSDLSGPSASDQTAPGQDSTFTAGDQSTTSQATGQQVPTGPDDQSSILGLNGNDLSSSFQQPTGSGASGSGGSLDGIQTPAELFSQNQFGQSGPTSISLNGPTSNPGRNNVFGSYQIPSQAAQSYISLPNGIDLFNQHETGNYLPSTSAFDPSEFLQSHVQMIRKRSSKPQRIGINRNSQSSAAFSTSNQLSSLTRTTRMQSTHFQNVSPQHYHYQYVY